MMKRKNDLHGLNYGIRDESKKNACQQYCKQASDFHDFVNVI